MKSGKNYKDVSIDIEGRTVSGRYEVSNRMVTVTSVYGSKSAVLGALSETALAKMLLRELANESAE